MNIPLYIVDAFTSRLFAGNPAAVCPLDDWLPDDLLQAIAAENNQSETAFFVNEHDAYRLRWFTPTMEVDLCGHATLATGHILFDRLGVRSDRVEFETQSGRLHVSKSDAGLAMDLPTRKAVRVDLNAEITHAIGIEPEEAYRSTQCMMAVLNDERAVRALTPDITKIRQLACQGMLVTAPGRACDFVSRFFSPQCGIPEDPVTGSAHCTLAPYWAERLRRHSLHALQVSSRGGELFCEYRGDRVTVGGRCVVYSTGAIELPNS